MDSGIVWLDASAERATLGLLGGKGAQLAALTRAGFAVPPGFVVTTDAFRAFIDVDGLRARIGDLTQPSNADDPDRLIATARAVSQLLDQQPLPKRLEQEILNGYRNLASRCDAFARDATRPFTPATDPAPLPVAVRSSATVEDLPDVSFAGGQETYLNVSGEMALLTAIRRCWSSLWSARARTYLTRRGIDPAAVDVAVVVQQMVASDAAGVLFTINPVTGSRQEMVINAAWGLGDAIVGGRVTPDTIVVDKKTDLVAHSTVGDKNVMSVLTNGGTEDVQVDTHRRLQPVLRSEQVAVLTGLGRALETHFGMPQDVEWALARERILILQSRPITAAGTRLEDVVPREPSAPGDDNWPALDERPPQDFDLWTQANVGEIWPQPVSPLVWSAVPFVVGTTTRYALRALESSRMESIQWAKRLYGRAYYNEGALAYVLSEEVGLPGSFVDAAVGSRRTASLQSDRRFDFLRLARRLPFWVRIIWSQLRSGPKLEALFPEIDRQVVGFAERSAQHLSDRELWDELTERIDAFIQVMNVSTELSISSMVAFGMLQDLTIRWCKRSDLAHDLIASLSGIRSAEMGIALWEMAQWLSRAGLADIILDKDPKAALQQLRQTPEASPLIGMLDAFLLRHGHHCPNEGEWLHPRWAEAPEQVVEVVASYLRARERIDPAAAAARQQLRREQAILSAKAHLSIAQRAVFLLVLRRTQRLVQLRENGKNCYVQASYPVRRTYALFGQRWFDRGWLAAPDDIFFLTMPEVERIVQSGSPDLVGLDPPTLVAERRRAFEYWFTVEAPDVVGPDRRPSLAQATVDSSTHVLHGIPVSGGIARGTVRVVADPAEARLLQPGDILVTRAIDPGWTPLFPLLAGIVVEVGGQLSHAAIVAREYGLPAVANAQHATCRLRTGQIVTVDGTIGKVFLESVE